MEDETEKRTDHAARIGSRVGIGCIAAVVLLLVATIYPSVPLMLAVCAMSVPQALFAARVGRVLGPKIAAGSILRAVPIGALALKVGIAGTRTNEEASFCQRVIRV